MRGGAPGLYDQRRGNRARKVCDDFLRARVLLEIRELEARASATEPVVYSDELDIHLNPKIGRDWMLRGLQRRVIAPGRNEKFYIAGALDVCSGKQLTTGASRKNVALFCQLLWRIASRDRRARRIHLIVDNYGVHEVSMVERVLADVHGRIVLHFLSPCCPTTTASSASGSTCTPTSRAA